MAGLRPEMAFFTLVISSANHMKNEIIVSEAVWNFSFLDRKARWEGGRREGVNSQKPMCITR